MIPPIRRKAGMRPKRADRSIPTSGQRTIRLYYITNHCPLAVFKNICIECAIIIQKRRKYHPYGDFDDTTAQDEKTEVIGMNRKMKACIVATLLLLCGRAASVTAQENMAVLNQSAANASNIEKEIEEAEALLKKSPYDYWDLHHGQVVLNRSGGYYEYSISLWKAEYERLAKILKPNHAH